jgi:hypothetical protein
MELTIDRLKQVFKNKGYAWREDRPNIIGVRTNINVPDVFNDFLCVVYKDNGAEVIKTYLITTEPGITHQKDLLNPEGCAVIEPGQYKDAYALGFHQGKDGIKINPKKGVPYPKHRALVLVGDITIKRDKDKDGIAGNSGTIMSGKNTGCNIHGTMDGPKTEKIGPWSAGCQVHAIWKNKEEMCDICEKFRAVTKNRFDYTLILEKDLV